MAIFQSDLSIKTAIELGLEDIRKNPWLIEDILGDLLTNPYLREKYGENQIESCKEWFRNNQVDVYMDLRKDRDRFPCVTINLGSSQEKDEMKHMADQSTETVVLLPNQINKPIPFVVKPFVHTGYNAATGEVSVPASVDLSNVAQEMILVDPSTGQGYQILDIADGIIIEDGLTITATQFAVVPKNQFYKARVEHTFFQETYTIGCHVHGDPQALLWLHSIVLYSLLRYREGLLEANGFTQSSVSSSDLMSNALYSAPSGEEVWTRVITLTGMVENSWIKSPRRVIESIALREKVSDGYIGGIKILSNLDVPPTIDPAEESWYTVDGEEDED